MSRSTSAQRILFGILAVALLAGMSPKPPAKTIDATPAAYQAWRNAIVQIGPNLVASHRRGIFGRLRHIEPFLVLSQLSRASEPRIGDHKPQLSDLRDSGSIEQDADLVAFIFREEVYKRDREDLRGLADLIVAKQRNGPIGNVPLRFLGQFTRFENRAEDLPEEP